MIKLWSGSVGGCFIGSIAAMALYMGGLPSSSLAQIDQDLMYRIAAQNGVIAGGGTAAFLTFLGFGKPTRKELQLPTDPKAAIAQRMSDSSLTGSEFTQLSSNLVRLEELAMDRQPQALSGQPNQ